MPDTLRPPTTIDDRDHDDVARITQLLGDLHPTPTVGTTMDDVRREHRAIVNDVLAMIPPTGVTAEAAQAARQAIVNRYATHDLTLSFEPPTASPELPRSVFSRSPRPLGRVTGLDGRPQDVDERTALQLLVQGYEAITRLDANAQRRAEIRDLMIAVCWLLVPGSRGPQAVHAVERPWRAPVEPESLVTAYDALHRVVMRREETLPDVWHASDPAPDGSPLGFGGMSPSEIVYRILASRLGFARTTGWKRAQELVNDARRRIAPTTTA